MFKEFFPKSFVLLALGILTIPVALALYSPATVVSAQTGETSGALTVVDAQGRALAYFGAKVLHPKTIQPAIESCIPVRICNSRAPQEPGTLVGPETETSPRTVKAIAHKS